MGVMLPHSLRASATFGLRRIISIAIPASESSTAGSGPRKRASITASVSGLSSNLFTLMSGPGKRTDRVLQSGAQRFGFFGGTCLYQ